MKSEFIQEIIGCTMYRVSTFPTKLQIAALLCKISRSKTPFSYKISYSGAMFLCKISTFYVSSSYLSPKISSLWLTKGHWNSSSSLDAIRKYHFILSFPGSSAQ